MKIEGEAKLLRIVVGEDDKIKNVSVYEKIVIEARENGLAGATAYKGIMGFGGSSVIHTSKIFRLSEDMPIVIEIVDNIEKINEFIPIVEDIFKLANCGGLITLEKAEIIKYTADK